MINSDDIKENLSNIKNKFIDRIKDLKEKLTKMVDLEDEKQLKMILSFTAGVLIILAGYVKTLGYDVIIEGEKLGTVRTSKEIDIVLDDLAEELGTTYNMDVILGDEIDLKKVNILDDKLSSEKELKDKLRNKASFLVKAYSLNIDGKMVGALENKEEMKSLLDSIKKPYLDSEDDNRKVKEVKLLEKVLVKKEEVPVYKISQKQDLYDKVINGGKDIKVHRVEVGETLWTIADIYGTSMEELIEANKDRNPDDLQIGDEVKLISSKPLLTVATISELQYDESIEYDLEVEYNDNMYNNEKETKVEGKQGKAKVLAKEVRHNGELVDKKVIKEEVIEKPRTQVIVKGTKEVPKTRATGVLAMATRGTISSRYGMRNGRMHKGLDISASAGTPIVASDGGRVVFSGWQGAYGYLVEIDHENGFRTKYAHCSKIHVSVGERVYKGQHIADVGNTGRSTGAHLHIEVLKNGQNVNPSNYLN